MFPCVNSHNDRVLLTTFFLPLEDVPARSENSYISIFAICVLQISVIKEEDKQILFSQHLQSVVVYQQNLLRLFRGRITVQHPTPEIWRF